MKATSQSEQFLHILQELPFLNKKLVLGRIRIGSNNLSTSAGVRFMPVAGGSWKYGVAEINVMNQRGSGRYSNDPIYITVLCMDFEKKYPGYEWFFAPNEEHTIYSHYD